MVELNINLTTEDTEVTEILNDILCDLRVLCGESFYLKRNAD